MADDDDLPTLRAAAAALLERAVAEAVSSVEDEQAYWAAVAPLQAADPRCVFDLIAPLARHDDPRLRELVPDTLRFLGGRPRPLLSPSVTLLATMLAEPQADEVIGSIATAFVDLAHPAAPALLRPFVSHPSSAVRLNIVHGLLTSAAHVVPELVTLSRDDDRDVRDWATFGLGSQLPRWGDADYVESTERREALWARRDDPDDEVRGEALVGLAGLRDARVWPLIEAELARETDWTHCVEAAELLGDARLLPALLARRARGDDSDQLASAIVACGVEAKP